MKLFVIRLNCLTMFDNEMDYENYEVRPFKNKTDAIVYAESLLENSTYHDDYQVFTLNEVEYE
jgi:hypothetical protein